MFSPVLFKKLAFISIASAILVASCGGDDDSDNKVKESEVKENYVKMAHAVYSDSLSTVEALQAAIDVFLADPTEVKLTTAKAAYKASRAPYQQSEIMRWDTDITLGTGTGDTGIESVDAWEGQVNAWPLAEGLIDYITVDAENNIISGSDEINETFLISQNNLNDDEANVATGIHAIEFLLWGQDLNGIDAGAGNRPATDFDVDNCTNENCDRRAQYLRVVVQLLVDDLVEMVAEWSPTAVEREGTLAHNFMQADNGLAYILGSMKVMADDELASARMGTALTTGDTEEEHDCFSDMSHIAIYNNFQGIKNAYYGRYESVSGPSVSDMLKQVDSELSTTIDSMMVSIEAKMSRIVEIGERETDTIRFDQLIGLGAGNVEFDNANAASLELIELGKELDMAREALSLQELNIDGGGDGD